LQLATSDLGDAGFDESSRVDVDREKMTLESPFLKLVLKMMTFISY
jgi:hypothetical protein